MKTELIERQHYERHESGTLDFEAPDGPPIAAAPHDHSRGRQNPNSKRAFERANRGVDAKYKLILDRLTDAGEYGMTNCEFVAWYNAHLPYVAEQLLSGDEAKAITESMVSGRYSELDKHLRRIHQPGQREGAHGIWTLAVYPAAVRTTTNKPKWMEGSK